MNKQELYIKLTVIYPLEDIITKLSNDEFRDNDFGYLEDNLNKYVSLAAKLLGKETPLRREMKGYTLNSYHKEKYLDYFNKLLGLFKSI